MTVARPSKAVFANEAALCAAFIAAVPDGWTCYPETAGFDILLVRAMDGAQIGVEAKMTLNAKVLLQAVEGIYSGHGYEYGGAPDFRAALVPYGTAGAEMKCIARYLGVTVIECSDPVSREAFIEAEVARYESWEFTTQETRRRYAEESANRDFPKFKPELPAAGKGQWHQDFVDFCPQRRCAVPDYVPDVVAGASGPSQLSEWKVKAIKISILLEKRGYLVTKDFADIRIDRKRWLDMGWLAAGDARGKYVAGKHPINFRAAHPVNYGQIESDFEKWKPPGFDTAPLLQGALI